LGIEAEEKEKAMKKKFAKVPKRAQEKVEAEYHRMKPEDFDQTMSAAKRQSPDSIRLPSNLVKKLKTVAKQQGEAEYQTIVKAWIKERLERKADAR
jgi:2-oxoglutarate dehydrogenase complex dehydrogenase (E1) component-like enzyme